MLCPREVSSFLGGSSLLSSPTLSGSSSSKDGLSLSEVSTGVGGVVLDVPLVRASS
jgi:hypothetical protein